MFFPENSFFIKIIIKLAPILLLFVQACSKEKLGERLANNFDYPEIEVSRGTAIKMTKKVDKENQLNDLQDKNQRKVKVILKKKNQNNLQEKKQNYQTLSTRKLGIANFRPQPYRIIIKLSAANPSAPAESLTKVLRQAGIQFEVERIERFEISPKKR